MIPWVSLRAEPHLASSLLFWTAQQCLSPPFIFSPHLSVCIAGAVQLQNELSASFGLELPPTVTFDYPTPAALARFTAGQAANRPAGASPTTQRLPPADAVIPAASEAATAGPAAARGAADVTAAVASIVATVLGAEVAQDEPLMAAGLDSLGERTLLCSACMLTVLCACLGMLLPSNATTVS